jgi:DNA invertase Pin-like site-specific DNA recombinase
MLKALDDTWLDTTSPHGELIFTIMGAMAEFERKLIRQRCEEGIRRAKARGKQFGRPAAGSHRKTESHTAPAQIMPRSEHANTLLSPKSSGASKAARAPVRAATTA